ncbi:hypothetical protein AbraIFM66950_002399 [Aspergillus brasiliensis]|nr:hypothetical protein AbraIFM66950_002399 [Aspergillus brasiliensis]
MTSGSKRSHHDYAVAWICALPVELAAAQALLDEVHNQLPAGPVDTNVYTLGSMNGHNIVLTCLPSGVCGTISAAVVATQLMSTFQSIQFALLVGIGGGIPSANADIRLGDVVVARPNGRNGGVVQYDFGKAPTTGFERTGILNGPPRFLLNALSKVEANQYQKTVNLFPSGPTRTGVHLPVRWMWKVRYVEDRYRPVRHDDSPVVHYGLVASGNQVVKDSHLRDRLGQELGAYCVEMEAAGLINHLPCLVIRGICDYADSHKNDSWHGYAAATAAAYAKELLAVIPISQRHMAFSIEDTWSKYHIPFQLTDVPAISNFVGRGDSLLKLWDILQPNAVMTRKVVVLYGMGGLGKTQLAAQFARMHKQDFTSIFWLHGKDETTLNASFADFVARVKALGAIRGKDHPPVREGPDARAKRALEWLSEKNNTGWLLIYDDVEAGDIERWLPTADHGSIIITIRSQQVAGTGMLAHPLKPLPFEEALQLLAGEAGLANNTPSGCENDPSPEELAKRLHGLPLALALAGSYIHRTGMSCSKYLEYYQREWCNLQAAAESPREYSHGNLRTTWRLNKNAPTIVAVTVGLNARSALDKNDWSLQQRLLYHANKVMLLPRDEHAESGDTEVLSALHTIGRLYWTHGKHDRAEEVYQRALVGRELVLGPNHIVTLQTVHNLGLLYHDRGDLSSSEVMFQRALSGYKSTHVDNTHLEALDTLQSLANLYHAQGRLDEAESLCCKALAGYQNLLTANSPSTLDAMHNLANIYFSKHRLPEAEELYNQALRGKLKSLGEDHTSTLDTIHNVGVVYFEHGRLQEAEEMCERALSGKVRLFGPDHASVFDTLFQLGTLYRSQGRLEAAEEMYERALLGREKVLGSCHSSTLHTIHHIGNLYYTQGRLQKAEQMQERALDGYDSTFGHDHPYTLELAHTLAVFCCQRGKLDKAESLLQRVRSAKEQIHGQFSGPVLAILNNLANVYREQGKLRDAEETYKLVLAEWRKRSPINPAALGALNNLGVIYQDQHRLKEAKKAFKEALNGYESVLAPDHILILDTASNLGELYQAQHKPRRAKEL